MLRCLTDKIDEIKAEACRKEVYYYEKMEVENYKNDIILAEACRSDVEKYCANVEAGGCGLGAEVACCVVSYLGGACQSLHALWEWRRALQLRCWV